MTFEIIMMDIGFLLLFIFSILTYLCLSVWFMFILHRNTFYYETMFEIYIKTMNIIPITRIIGLVGYCIVITNTFLLGGLGVAGIGLFYVSNKAMCWLLTGKFEWSRKK